MNHMRFSVLASGSKGNACYIETENSKILIDAGLSCRETVRRLELMGVAPGQLDAIIITHEHMDHIKGVGPLARRFNLPVYINDRTLRKGSKILGLLPNPQVIEPGLDFMINGTKLETFTKCHDAADPIGLVISFNSERIGLATDLGRSTRLVEDRLKECQALILEFNHDQGMLEEGPYPLFLKRRIKGSDGHLSNKQAAELLRAVFHNGLKQLVLAHLSEINNHPEKAYQEADEVLNDCGRSETTIWISLQDKPTPMIEL